MIEKKKDNFKQNQTNSTELTGLHKVMKPLESVNTSLGMHLHTKIKTRKLTRRAQTQLHFIKIEINIILSHAFGTIFFFFEDIHFACIGFQ